MDSSAEALYAGLRRSPDRRAIKEEALARSGGLLVNPGRDLEELYRHTVVGEEKGLGWQRHQIRGGNTKYPGGYTGWVSQPPTEAHVLETKFTKVAVRGYTGFRPNQGTVVGVPIIPSVEEQEGKERNLHGPSKSFADVRKPEQRGGGSFAANFRTAAKNMDLLERYNTARANIHERGQSQEYLLAQVQAKLSSRVHSMAEQRIHVRKLFESFDWDGNGMLDEIEFRACMERMNIQFDDFQALALFAFFDADNEGFISWQEFAAAAIVPNPKGGTAILPNPIIQVSFR
jgi:hypothetical protein